jgi:putative SOS response-associated peptidase YedK
MCYSVMMRRDIRALEKKFGPLIVRNDEAAQFEERRRNHPKLFPALDDRIYAGRFAPVVHRLCERNDEGALGLTLMRYSAFPPTYVENPSKLSTFNARRDNLRSPFWKSAFGKGHGVVLASGFFEWVSVRDLLKAGRVDLASVVAEFERQREARRARAEVEGKRFAPTKTELTDARFRKCIIHFTAQAGADLVLPVIFNSGELGGCDVKGFAIVTDDPPSDVSDAGHDRCPVMFEDDAWRAWIEPRGKTPRDLDALLGAQRRPPLVHDLDASTAV